MACPLCIMEVRFAKEKVYMIKILRTNGTRNYIISMIYVSVVNRWRVLIYLK